MVAARRSGLKVLIFPKDNLRDYESSRLYPERLQFICGKLWEVFHMPFLRKKRGRWHLKPLWSMPIKENHLLPISWRRCLAPSQNKKMHLNGSWPPSCRTPSNDFEAPSRWCPDRALNPIALFRIKALNVPFPFRVRLQMMAALEFWSSHLVRWNRSAEFALNYSTDVMSWSRIWRKLHQAEQFDRMERMHCPLFRTFDFSHYPQDPGRNKDRLIEAK